MVLYYVWVFGVRAQAVEQRGYETLFTYLMTLPLIGSIINVLGTDVIETSKSVTGLSRANTSHRNGWSSFVTKAMYLLLHYTFGVVAMLLAVLLWHSFAAHFVFVLSILFGSAWNGSLFYFKYVEFYNQNLESEKKA